MALLLELEFLIIFDKKLLFDSKSIREEKYTVKEKSRTEDKGTKGSSEENWIMKVWILPKEGEGETEEARPS
jgi:hypothetical protein